MVSECDGGMIPPRDGPQWAPERNLDIECGYCGRIHKTFDATEHILACELHPLFHRIRELRADIEADERDFRMIAAELGCESTREEILKAVRALKEKA